MRHRRGAAALLAACGITAVVGAQDRPAPNAPASPAVYRPALKPPEFLEPFAAKVEPGQDAFVLEPAAKAIEARLRQLGDAMRAGPARTADDAGRLLAAAARGAAPFHEGAGGRPAGPLEVRATAGGQGASLDRAGLIRAVADAVAALGTIRTTEFQVTAIEAADQAGTVRTDVRFDVVGTGPAAWRAEQVGTWRLRWQQGPGGWQITEWLAGPVTASRAGGPVFTEVTAASLGGLDAFRRQLTTPLDAWNGALDAVLTRDSNGHHGVSVGDADGDGLEDLYVAQPHGLPNRLFRARGDGTFEDATDRAGVGILDDTAHSLFADVDNDGDQDLVIATGLQPLLFANDGDGRFSAVAGAFRFDRPPQGVLTGLAMADYDRDGFLDVYLCVYSYFFGAGEDKAGTPMPYHDARNGPPGILLRNDGAGRFVDATAAAGLDAANDRYHFAAAWGDYDDDGWPDLLVANDFGVKNLYRNLGGSGAVRFEDVAAAAGVLDYGAGMSAAFLDYDNDGRLDIYTGNMWTADGLRVTASSAFMPAASAEVRGHYRQHARGNGLYRNLGNGRFEDRSVAARANMGRWAWASDTLDFDGDGWDDLYVVNGMLTRQDPDVEGFFWRQVVAQSPLTPVKGTPYDEAWRAINQLLLHQSIASRQRNVLLRNDGRGGFDEVSGTAGLDLEQDGRSFAVLDLDRDGDADLAIMAARQAPQLRLFRNEVGAAASWFSLSLTGSGRSNRDAVGARVVVETDRLTKTKIVRAGSGFLSQHSKTLSFGLGASERIRSLVVTWPSGAVQRFTDLAVRRHGRLAEGGRIAFDPDTVASPGRIVAAPPSPAAAPPPGESWLYEPFPAPPFSVPDLAGQTRSLSALAGKPALLLFWTATDAAGRAAADALGHGRDALSRAGVAAIAVSLDAASDLARVKQAAPAGLPVVAAPPDLAMSYALVNRHLFMNRQDLRLPTAFLIDGGGRIVKVYRERIDAARIAADAAAIDAPTPEARLARAVPFAGAFHAALPARNFLPYGRELMDQGLEAAAVVAFERAAQANPNASTLYRLGTLLARSGEPARARAAYERALALQPDLAEALNDLGALQARAGDIDGAVARFRAAIAATPDYPDALNNLGYALLVVGRNEEARSLYERALALQPDFPEALNNLGLLYGRAGDLDRAERLFREALGKRATYGEAAGNLALVLVNRGQTDAAARLLEDFIAKVPAYEGTYVTLARIHLSRGRTPEGLAVLERLLQRNPTHPVALEMLRQFRER